MQNFAKFLEKNVEWVALALGGLFLLWMLWGNVIGSPVSVTVAGKPLTPGQVAPMTLEGPGKRLQQAMASRDVPQMPVEDFLQDQQKQFSADPSALASLNGFWIGNLAVQVASVETPENQAPAVNPVVALPVAPPPINLQFSQGRSNVLIPNPGAAQAGGAINPAQGTPADRNWVSVSAVIPVQKLAQEFQAKKIPPALNLTTILRVEMVRQEQDAAGNWGPDKVIAPLPNVTLEPLPAQADGLTAQLAYLKWAEESQHQADLLQPPFYQVVQADPWLVPGTPRPEQALLAVEPFDPSKVNNPATLTPDQMAIYRDYQDKQRAAEKEKQKANRERAHSKSPRPNANNQGGDMGPPPGFPGYSGRAGGAGTPTRRPTPPPPPTMTRPPLMPPGGYPGQYRPDANPGMPGYPMPGAFGQPGAANPVAGAIPQGAFNPANQSDITVWAHDDSVVPGKTYRYRLRYYIKNPVLQTFNVCQPQKLAEIFDIASDYSDWTVPINVQSETNFYAVNTAPSQVAVKATFEIFRWKNGAWQVQTVDAHPGDMVGTPQGDGNNRVDFTTGWTLVDVREDPLHPDSKTIVLTSTNGQTLKRDLSADRTNPEHKRLQDLVNAAAGAAAAGPGNGSTALGPQ
jgi:hypothetical protein